MSEHLIDHLKLAEAVRRKRRDLRLTLKEASGQIGLPAASIWNVESGKFYPLPETIARVCAWLQRPVDRFYFETQTLEAKAYSTNEPLPVRIDAILAADKSLNKKSRLIIGNIFRAAYESVTT